LLNKLRKASTRNDTQKLELSEHITWFYRNKNNLLSQVIHELFTQLLWVEKGTVKKLRESLMGTAWSISEDMLSNPLLQTPDTHNPEILMKHYVLLSQYPDSTYGFDRLSVVIDKLLDNVGKTCQLQIVPSLEYKGTNPQFIEETVDSVCFSWKDSPANMEILFNGQKNQQALEEESTKQDATLKATLQFQHQANQILKSGAQKAGVIKHLLAAYETPHLYKNYFKLIKPYLLYQTLCNEAEEVEVELKLKNQLKIRALRRTDQKKLSINQLKSAKKRLAKLARNPDSQILRRFITHFVTYRRDLKYYRLVHEAMDKIHLLEDEAALQLSRSNDMLH